MLFYTSCLLFLLNIHFLFFLKINPLNRSRLNDTYINGYMKEISKRTHINISYSVLMHKNSTKAFAQSTEFQSANFECSGNNNNFQSYKFFINNILFWLDLLINFVIPLLTLMILLVYVLITLRVSNKYNLSESIRLKRLKRNRLFLIKLFILNAYFFLSYLPHHIFSSMNEQTYNQNLVWFTFFNILLYSNNVATFFFYGISSQKFRRELKKVWAFFF